MHNFHKRALNKKEPAPFFEQRQGKECINFWMVLDFNY